MELDDKVKNQFIRPDGFNRELIEQKIGEVTTQLLDFLSNASNKPANPDFIKLDSGHFRIPDFSQTENSIKENLQSLYDLSINPANSKYIGHMDSIPTLWSIIGDYVASALNNNLLSLEMSPYLTQVEYSLTRQLATLFGLPKSAGGVMLSGGTLSNLQALVVARNAKLNIKNGNILSLKKEPVIFASEHAHASIQKIGMLIGIGADNIIKIRTQNSKMEPANLEFQINAQINLGKQPFAIVATAGTTVSGNIDPLEDISKIAAKFDLWLHIDAIYGGAVIFSNKYKHLIKGIEHANSISFNPQKWLYVAKTSSMVLFREFTDMVQNFRVSAPYMKEQTDYINLGEIGIQGTKHAEVLKLWLSLLSLGKTGYSQLIDYGFDLTHKFVLEISKRYYLKMASKPELNLVCFRVEPEQLKEKELDHWNERLQDYLSKETDFFLSLPKYNGSLWLRAVLLNPFLNAEHIDTLFNHIDHFVKINSLK